MRLVALLAWYDEDPAWLERMVRSLATLGVDRLIALDGAYALYPDGKAMSPMEQHWAIVRAASDAKVQLTLHTPGEVWAGNELEKRNQLFELGEQRTDPTDWYVVVDADEEIIQAPNDLHAQLERSPFHVGGVTLTEPGHALGPIVFQTFPMFFRAIRGIRCHVNHFTYRTPDGKLLWGDARRQRLEPRWDLSDVMVVHHKQFRHRERKDGQMSYYQTRDENGVEELPPNRHVLGERAS